jgi:uncharacterized protein (TIGR00251 family)
MGSGPWLQTRPDAVLLQIRVQPRARREGSAGVAGDRLKLCVAAAPTEGRANAAIVALVAGLAGVPRAAVAIVRGRTSRSKTIRITTTTPRDLAERIRTAVGACATR